MLDDTNKTLTSLPGLLDGKDPSDEESETELPMKPPSQTLPSIHSSKPTLLHAPDPNDDDWDIAVNRMDVDSAHRRLPNQKFLYPLPALPPSPSKVKP